MPENRGKLAAAASVVVVGVGGVVGHSSGVFRTTADDVARGPGRVVDDVPPPRDPNLPPAGGAEVAATDDLAREGRDDVDAKEVICFAYENFTDDTTGEFVAPSEAEFVRSVGTLLAPEGSQLSYRLKADSLYEKLDHPETDMKDVANEILC